MPRKSHISLIVKGPLKSARRAAQRHGLSTASCHAVSGDVQCYAPCSTSAERKVAEWYTERSRVKAGRGHPPGTLLYYSGSCSTGGLGRRKRHGRRKVGGK